MTTLRRPVALFGAAAAVAALAGMLTPPAAADEPAPQVGMAMAINNWNVAVGHATTTQFQQHAVRWNASGQITDLGTLPGGTESIANAINNVGEIVGLGAEANGWGLAVRWSPDGQISAMDSLTTSPETDDVPEAINDAGTAVGYATDSSQAAHGVRWSPDGSITELGRLSGYSQSNAFAINDSGVSVGSSTAETATAMVVTAVRWDAAGRPSALAKPTADAGYDSWAYGINNLGDIVGFGGLGINGPFQALEWDPAGRVHVIASSPYN